MKMKYSFSYMFINRCLYKELCLVFKKKQRCLSTGKMSGKTVAELQVPA
jgi:hypothetical protein